MYDDLRELNRSWKEAFFARSFELEIELHEVAGVRFHWDTAPSGWLRFSAKDAWGTVLHTVTAWPGASKGTLVTEVITALTVPRAPEGLVVEPAMLDDY